MRVLRKSNNAITWLHVVDNGSERHSAQKSLCEMLQRHRSNTSLSVGSLGSRKHFPVSYISMNNLPNLITSIRLFAAIVLIYLGTSDRFHGTRYFLPIFIAAGISDMLDGFIARRFNWCTEFGAKLDSISDLALYAGVAIFLSINARSELAQSFWIFLLGCVIQLIHWLFSLSRFGQFPAYHSTFSRFVAYCMFFGLIAFWQTRAPLIIDVLAVAWIATSIEGIAITQLLKRPRINVSSIRSASLSSHRT